MKKLTQEKLDEILSYLSGHVELLPINMLIAEYVIGWTKIKIEEVNNQKIAYGCPWIYNFRTEQHCWLPSAPVPNFIEKSFYNFQFVVGSFCGIKAVWDGIAWNVTLDKLEGGNGEKVSAMEASFEYALAKAAILAFAGIWNVSIGLSGVYGEGS